MVSNIRAVFFIKNGESGFNDEVLQKYKPVAGVNDNSNHLNAILCKNSFIRRIKGRDAR